MRRIGLDDGALGGIAGVCGGQCHPVLQAVLRGQKRQIGRSGVSVRQHLQVVCGGLRLDADALRGMLSLLVDKGKVAKKSATSECGTGCCKCDSTLVEIYEWRNSENSSQ